MRLIHAFQRLEEAQVFSLFLSFKKIDNKIEIDKSQSPSYQVWGVQEEQLSTASQHLQEFLKNPDDPQFEKIRKTASSFNQAFQDIVQKFQKRKQRKVYAPFLSQGFLVLCISISIFLNFPQYFEPNLYNYLSYDYNPQANSYPGIFSYLLLSLKGLSIPFSLWWEHHSLFSSIQAGQWWRLFTPALMHMDIFHLIFNMLWLYTLGPQIEARLSPFKYLFMILLVGIVSNFCQYLVTGSHFLGFSGVVLGMLGFIWMRQKLALWEGYQVHSSTYTFIAIYTVGLLILEGASVLNFLFKGQLLFGGGMANTAHITGFLTGMLLARLPFFEFKQ